MADLARSRLAGPTFIVPTNNDFQNFTLDATTDAMEWVLQVEEAATITQIGFRYGARTGTPPTFIISIQGVGTTGNPDGTILGGGSPASQTFTPPADTSWDGTWRTVTLANSIAVTRGQWISVVIAYSSGTIDAGNSSSITSHTRISNPSCALSNYPIQNNAGSRTRQNFFPNIALYSASKTFFQPITAVATVSIRNDTGVEGAVKFTLPAGAGDTFKISGVAVVLSVATADTIRVQLYDTDGSTVLQTLSYDTDYITASGTVGIFKLLFNETTLSTLTFGSTYRIGFFGQVSGKAESLYVVDANSAQDLAALPGGSQYSYSSRSGGTGAWTDLTTRRPLVDLIFDDWTEPSAGGGAPIIGSSIIRGVRQ